MLSVDQVSLRLRCAILTKVVNASYRRDKALGFSDKRVGSPPVTT